MEKLFKKVNKSCLSFTGFGPRQTSHLNCSPNKQLLSHQRSGRIYAFITSRLYFGGGDDKYSTFTAAYFLDTRQLFEWSHFLILYSFVLCPSRTSRYTPAARSRYTCSTVPLHLQQFMTKFSVANLMNYFIILGDHCARNFRLYKRTGLFNHL